MINFSCITNVWLPLAYCLLVGLALFSLSILAVKKFIKIAYKFNILDVPNDRSSHTLPIPRGGGAIIAFLSQSLIILLYLLGYLHINIALALSCALIVSIVGFVDDIFKLSIRFRLLMQLVASLIAASLIVPINFDSPTSIGMFLMSVLVIMWSTNLFNFMDGTDGLAAFEAIFVLMISGFLLYLTTNNSGFSYCLLLIGTIIAGFLWFNWPKAKIFMGDVGSCFLGFLIGISALISHFIFGVSLFFWLIVYAAFCFDATITLFRRFMSGQKWYLSHRSHAYQRLQNIGWKHKDILCRLIVLDVCLGFIALMAYYYDFLLMASCLVVILLSVIYLLIEFYEKVYEKNI